MKKLILLVALAGTFVSMTACQSVTRETRSVDTPIGSVSSTTTKVE